MELYNKPIKTIKAADLIVKEIWQLILDGRLSPGDRLPPEHELMAQFQVSKLTLREALQTLEAYGHITRKRGAIGGSVVLDILPDNGINFIINYLRMKKLSLESLIRARALLEPLIAEEAARNIRPDGAKKLQENLDNHVRDMQVKGCSKSGWLFYLILAEISGNEVLLIVEEILVRLLLDAEFALGISDIESSEEQKPYNENTLKHQQRIAEAVIGGDPEEARRRMLRLREEWARLIRGIAAKRTSKK